MIPGGILRQWRNESTSPRARDGADSVTERRGDERGGCLVARSACQKKKKNGERKVQNTRSRDSRAESVREASTCSEPRRPRRSLLSWPGSRRKEKSAGALGRAPAPARLQEITAERKISEAGGKRGRGPSAFVQSCDFFFLSLSFSLSLRSAWTRLSGLMKSLTSQ